MSWVARTRERVAVRATADRAYADALPAMEAAYATLSLSDQARLEALDERFRAGETEPLVHWAQTHVDPRLFTGYVAELPELPTLPVAPGVEALEALPPWAREPVWHGTSVQALEAIAVQGINLPPAESSSEVGDEYGWDATWCDEVWGSYTHDLDDSARARLAGMLGGTPRRCGDFADAVSLFWVSRTRSVAASYAVPCRVNLELLRYYWWFPDEILGERSTVFVCPVGGPQAPPELLSPAGFP